MARSDFVHLHTHTEYSMLDGAASNERLFAEVARQGMPAVAMTDHGNMFGAYEFFQIAKKYDGNENPLVKPIIGIEAYVAPSSRHSRKQEFWGRRRGDGGDPDVEGGKDVSGGGRYTHMTMWAKNPTGLHNLFTLSSLASYEGYYMKLAWTARSSASTTKGSSPPPVAHQVRSRPDCGWGSSTRPSRRLVPIRRSSARITTSASSWTTV